jgi:hypothetical protein
MNYGPNCMGFDALLAHYRAAQFERKKKNNNKKLLCIFCTLLCNLCVWCYLCPVDEMWWKEWVEFGEVLVCDIPYAMMCVITKGVVSNFILVRLFLIIICPQIIFDYQLIISDNHLWSDLFLIIIYYALWTFLLVCFLVEFCVNCWLHTNTHSFIMLKNLLLLL